MNMNKSIVAGIVLASLLFAASQANADMTLKMYDSYGTTGGGEFRLQTLDGWTVTPGSLGEQTSPFQFESFCLEKQEHVAFNTTYHAEISTEARQGGGGAVNGGDPISAQTAYLYEQFITGNLGGYSYTPGAARVSSANALQRVIWFLEDEQSMNWSSGSLEDSFYQNALANAGADIGNVRVLNLYADAAHTLFKQDQLIYVPGIPIAVPAPGAVVLGAAGLGLVGFLRRRFVADGV